MTLTDKVNLGLISTTALVVVWVFSTFASASDLEDFKDEQKVLVGELLLDQWYGQFYDRLDDRDEAVEEDNTELAAEYNRQMEKLRAKICEQDPQWERCDD